MTGQAKAKAAMYGMTACRFVRATSISDSEVDACLQAINIASGARASGVPDPKTDLNKARSQLSTVNPHPHMQAWSPVYYSYVTYSCFLFTLFKLQYVL